MRILIVTQWFEPEPAFKGLAFAKGLAKQGHEVEVLTGFPNYPGGKLYPGYRVRLFQREYVDGIPVTRVALYPSHDGNPLHRIANYVSFALSSACLGPWLIKRPDVVYCYQPPATAGLTALAFRFLKGTPFVYDIQDLWPDTLSATGMVRSPKVLRAVGLWCRIVYHQASRIAVLSPGFKQCLASRGVPPSKVHVIYNWSPEECVAQQSPHSTVSEDPRLSGKFCVLFAGTMGKAQALDTVLESARKVAAKDREVLFVFVGGGIERSRLEETARQMDLQNVLFLPRLPLSEIGPLLSRADALLVHLRRDPLFAITIPSKIQAYLAAGRPILGAILGDAGDLIENAGAGLRCEPENPDALAEAVLTLKAMSPEQRQGLGSNGRAFYERHLSMEVGVRKFQDLFAALRPQPIWRSLVLRTMDVCAATVGLILVSPILATVALAIRVKMGRPICFRQVRPGLYGKPFTILKFRTMSTERNESGDLLSDEQRLTPLGKWIRQWSLDELPQLWNVLKGDLSLVGPRPLLMRYLDRYTPEQVRRMDVRPGITGWAQINGRNAVSWKERFELDCWYVDHQSIGLYFKILFKTAVKTVKREGISGVGHATMPEFMG